MKKIQVLWDVIPCPLVNIYRRFGDVESPFLESSSPFTVEDGSTMILRG
jgi:hypothetical protein